MKTTNIVHGFLAMNIKTLVAVFFSTCLLYSAVGQGALTPPGAPAAMMKTLDQIEPRTPVNTNTAPGNSSAQFVISQPGSYYLTGNITSAGVSGQNGIEIVTNNVTLDLNGFSLLAVQNIASGNNTVHDSAIYLTSNCNNITVRNGIISGWGLTGLYAVSSANDTFEHLTVVDNMWGMDCLGRVIIKDCLVASNSWNGIAIVPGSDGSEVIDNEIAGNDTSGSSQLGALIIQSSNNRIEGNHITGNSGAGIWIATSAYLTDFNNIVIGNSVIGFGANNYIIVAGNDVGPIGNASTNASPWANFSH